MQNQPARVAAGELPDHQIADLLEELGAAGVEVRRDLPDPGPEGVPEPGRTVATVTVAADPGSAFDELLGNPIRRWLDRHGHSPETIVAIKDPDGRLLRQIQLEEV